MVTLKQHQEFIKSIVKSNIPYSYENFGKMIRSKLAILLLKCYDIKIEEKHLKFLSAIELIHLSSLLHDDVIDREDKRRDMKSLNAEFGNKRAILYGNVILSNAIKIILELKSMDLIDLINNTVKSMCEGELLQLSKLNKIPTIEEYIQKSKLKTATLFDCSIKGLNILSVNFPKTEFGELFGIAYQIKNDLDDWRGEISSDIQNGIYTAPFIYEQSSNKKTAIEKTNGLIDNYCMSLIETLKDIRDCEYKNSLMGAIRCLKE